MNMLICLLRFSVNKEEAMKHFKMTIEKGNSQGLFLYLLLFDDRYQGMKSAMEEKKKMKKKHF